MANLLDKNIVNKEEKSLNSPILDRIQISSQESMLIRSLEKYYSTDLNKMKIMLPIIRGMSKISLRVIDHFITNYSKKNRITYNLIENNQVQIFNVNASYKSQLKAYNKKYFDPFCRGNRIPFFYDKNSCIITTIGQLNFFKWAISKDVINWVSNNLELIEADMNKTNKRDSKKVKKYKTYYNKPVNNFIQPINETKVVKEKKKVKIFVTFE